jgi:chromosome segregation ATPase
MTTESPASRLGQAHDALDLAEQAEAAERAKGIELLERERQTHYALEQAARGLRTAQGREGIQAARTQATELEHAHRVLTQARYEQEQAVKACHERTKDARLAVEQLEQEAARLRRAIRHAEQVVGARQRATLDEAGTVARAQEGLVRTQRGLAEAATALDRLRDELARLEEVHREPRPRRGDKRSENT